MTVVACGGGQVGRLLARLGHIGLVSKRRTGRPEIDIVLQLFLDSRGTGSERPLDPEAASIALPRT
jgi:hypothetical protein